MDELRKAANKISNGKTPGTDGVPGEFLKWLNNDSASELILDLLNDLWTLETLPSDNKIARVVTIYKKGNPDLPSNYRPISLLQSI